MKILLTLVLFLASNAAAFDVGGSLPQGLGDGRYVLKSGDVMSGPLQTTSLTASSGTFTGNAQVNGSAFSVGGSSLAVQYGNVGIGTTAPATTLGVSGGVQISSSAAIAPAMAVGVREGLHFTHTVSNGNSRITSSRGAVNSKLQIVSTDIDVYTDVGTLSLSLPANGSTVMRVASAKLIMTSPDGTCSACGPDNSDVWACSSVACP